MTEQWTPVGGVIKGDKGDPGPTGATGPAGATGAAGAVGAPGLKGDTGPTGATGPTGPQGAVGNSGPGGPVGPTGPAGPTGPTGPQADVTGQLPAVLVNMTRNPIFQTNTAEWTNTNGTLTRQAPGLAVWACTSAGATNASIYLPSTTAAFRAPITPGQFGHGGILVKALKDFDCRPLVAFFDAAGNNISSFTQTAQQVNNGETRVVGATDFIAPPNAATWYLRVIITDRGVNTLAAGDVFQVLGGFVTSTATTLGWSPVDIPVLDLYGGRPGVRWQGAAHASYSEVYAPPLTLQEAIGRDEYHGRGSPEGVVDGPKGASYRDDDQVNGARLWRKTSAQGSRVGWVVVDGDTGWRMLIQGGAASLGYTLAPGFTLPNNHYIYIRRVNGTVYLRIIGNLLYTGSAGASRLLFVEALPVGFGSYYHSGTWRTLSPLGAAAVGPELGSGASPQRLMVDSTGVSSTNYSYGLASWLAPDQGAGNQWPSTLPGSAALT